MQSLLKSVEGYLPAKLTPYSATYHWDLARTGCSRGIRVVDGTQDQATNSSLQNLTCCLHGTGRPQLQLQSHLSTRPAPPKKHHSCNHQQSDWTQFLETIEEWQVLRTALSTAQCSAEHFSE
mmetsp:Transcript_80515/g.134714  ORF Transcript_80515/g.134714 Transcript_80515/m.134714 type:complete len:122 (-) Transcript_80515:203-568(-)